MARYLKCPHCKHTSTDRLWDIQTKEELNLAENHPDIVPASNCKDSDEEPFFFCPVCERKVEGKDIITDDDIE